MAAPNAIIYKAELQVSDMDRHYYANHNLTLAQHPSETDLRLMARLTAMIQDGELQLMSDTDNVSIRPVWHKKP